MEPLERHAGMRRWAIRMQWQAAVLRHIYSLADGRPLVPLAPLCVISPAFPPDKVLHLLPLAALLRDLRPPFSFKQQWRGSAVPDFRRARMRMRVR
jgi:hypothetical protein